MKRLWLILIGSVAVAVPVAVLAGGGDGGFDGVVRSIESRYHVRATRIPFLGLISFVSRRASHGAVGGIHVAEFESFTEPVDGDELNHMVEEKLGAGWERIVRETSRKGNEQTLVFIHPEGDRMGMQVSVDPKHLDDDIGKYGHHHHDDADKQSDDGGDDSD
jgi:hypothetical protein